MAALALEMQSCSMVSINLIIFEYYYKYILHLFIRFAKQFLRMAQIIIAEDNTDKISKIISPKQGKGGLFLGNQKAANDINLLKKYAITAVITIAKELDPKYGLSMSHIKISVQDQPLVYIYPYFDETYSFIKKELSQGNVFIHCKMGISRSASLVIAYVMRKYKCSFEKACSQVKKKRSIVNPNQGFVLQLKEYEKKLKQIQ